MNQIKNKWASAFLNFDNKNNSRTLKNFNSYFIIWDEVITLN